MKWAKRAKRKTWRKFFTLRAPAEARPEARIRKSLFFPCFSLNFWPTTRFLKSRDPGGHSYQARAHETSSWPISWRKLFFLQKSDQKGPFPNERSWNFASIGAMDTSVRPNLTELVAKTCNKSLKMSFPTVPDSSQGFTEASRRFPILLEGLR